MTGDCLLTEQKNMVNKIFTVRFRKFSVSDIIFVYRNNQASSVKCFGHHLNKEPGNQT